MPSLELTAIDSIATAAREAGARVLLHARDLRSGAEVDLDADEPVVLASVFKVPVAVELARQFGEGRLTPTQRVVVPAGDRTEGGTGLSALVDEVDMSLQDLAQLMISVSDNAATDIVTGMVGLDNVNRTMADLGLTATVLERDCGLLLGRLVEDLDLSAEEREALAQDEDSALSAIPTSRWKACRDLQAATTNRSTPREMTRLLEMIWTDQAAPAEGCAFVRRIMGQQVWPHRLQSGFPSGVKTSGKTGTLPFVRNEVGVVEYPDGGRYAAAVFTVADVPTLRMPPVDALIGRAARLAVDDLRSRPTA